MAKVRDITEQNMRASFLTFTNASLLFAHFYVCSWVWVCMGSVPQCLLCCLFAPSTSNPMHFVADAEGKAAVFQPLAEFWRYECSQEVDVSLATQPQCTDKQVSLICPLWASACHRLLGPLLFIHKMGTVMPSFHSSPVLPALQLMLQATTAVSCCTFMPTSQKAR